MLKLERDLAGSHHIFPPRKPPQNLSGLDRANTPLKRRSPTCQISAQKHTLATPNPSYAWGKHEKMIYLRTERRRLYCFDCTSVGFICLFPLYSLHPTPLQCENFWLMASSTRAGWKQFELKGCLYLAAHIRAGSYLTPPRDRADIDHLPTGRMKISLGRTTPVSSWRAADPDTYTQCANHSTWHVIQPTGGQYGNGEHGKGAKGHPLL